MFFTHLFQPTQLLLLQSGTVYALGFAVTTYNFVETEFSSQAFKPLDDRGPWIGCALCRVLKA